MFSTSLLKKVIILVYTLLVVVMAAATIIEKYQGSSLVHSQIYGSWWFSALWALLTAAGVFWLLKRRVRRVGIVALHGALVIILAGALITHLTSRNGLIHLREGESTDSFLSQNEQEGPAIKGLPFSVRLDRFDILYHEGTRTAADYVSRLTVSDGSDSLKATVSMNAIFSRKGVWLYQTSFDEDGRGSYLSVNIDPWGIAVTYIGYALLFLSLIWMLLDPKGTFRRLLRSPELRKAASAVVVLASLGCATRSEAAPTLSKEQAEEFGKLYVLYNGRICQLQTYAIDFTKKLHGKASYDGYTAEQVLAGFIFYDKEWCEEPVIKVKGGTFKDHFNLDKHVSFNTFFSQEGYLLGPMLQEYYHGQNDKLHKEVADYDDKLQLILEIRHGTPLKLFPFRSKEADAGLSWYSPTDRYPADMEKERQEYMRNIFSILFQDVRSGHDARVMDAIGKMQRYQKTYGETSIPTTWQTRAERIYNRIPFATILFMVNLTMAFLSLFFRKPALVVMALSLVTLTCCILLRWVISGTVPMSNGYETMLLMAWAIETAALIMSKKAPIMVTFGLLMSGLFLLVSHIGQMNANITHIMPVLNSPLLCIHVSVIMLAYALLSITFACGVTALILPRKAAYLQVLSLIFLYPSITALCIGIFTGAIWANISWGTYWSWDPKEVWALITLMVYAVAVHSQSLPSLRKPLRYHLYVVIAFLALLMTYFGVNYFLGGMHSYA